MIEVRVPQLPESVTDATLVAWRKKAGERVTRDENLVDLETDKVVLEVPAPADGVLAEIKVNDGSTVTSGDLLAVVNASAAEAPAARAPTATRAEAPAAAAAPAPAPAVANDAERFGYKTIAQSATKAAAR